jgi:hypothetical protein
VTFSFVATRRVYRAPCYASPSTCCAGATPFGPYAGSHKLNPGTQATAKRCATSASIDATLSSLRTSMLHWDSFVERHILLLGQAAARKPTENQRKCVHFSGPVSLLIIVFFGTASYPSASACVAAAFPSLVAFRFCSLPNDCSLCCCSLPRLWRLVCCSIPN